MDQETQSQSSYPQQPAFPIDTGRQQPPTSRQPFPYGMGITAHALRQLATARKWAMFLAVIGFVGCAFMVVGAGFFGLSSGLLNEYFPDGGTTIQGLGIAAVLIYLVLAVIYFFPAFFLLRFSLQTKRALAVHSPDLITDALRHLKLFFAYVGILVIVSLGLSVAIALVTMVFASRQILLGV